MYHVTQRNERTTRTHALVLAIGLHLSLGAMLYFQMDEPPSTKKEAPVKINTAKENAVATAKTVSGS